MRTVNWRCCLWTSRRSWRSCAMNFTSSSCKWAISYNLWMNSSQRRKDTPSLRIISMKLTSNLQEKSIISVTLKSYSNLHPLTMMELSSESKMLCKKWRRSSTAANTSNFTALATSTVRSISPSSKTMIKLWRSSASTNWLNCQKLTKFRFRTSISLMIKQPSTEECSDISNLIWITTSKVPEKKTRKISK